MSTPTRPSPPPKPVSEVWRPGLVGLPVLTPARRIYRFFVRQLMRLVFFLLLKADVHDLENFPRSGPALLVTNHLGDADAALLVAALPAYLEALGKIELYDLPLLGRLLDWYGIIWLHRGQPDRRALRAALQGLREGRFLLIAPEGRMSLIQGLEPGTNGAAFLARKAGVQIVPLAMTGTENSSVYAHLKRLRRAPVSLTIGQPFQLEAEPGSELKPSEAAARDTRLIMERLAQLLPPEYRGVYREPGEI